MCKFGNSPLGDVPLGTYAIGGMDSKNLTFEHTIFASFLYDINDLMVKIKLLPQEFERSISGPRTTDWQLPKLAHPQIAGTPPAKLIKN